MLSTQELEQEQAHAPSRVCPPQHTPTHLHHLPPVLCQLPTSKSTSGAAVKSARDIVWHHWAGRWRAKAPKTRDEYDDDFRFMPKTKAERLQLPDPTTAWLLLNPNSAAASVSSGCQAGFLGGCCKCSLETRRRLAQVTNPPSPNHVESCIQHVMHRSTWLCVCVCALVSPAAITLIKKVQIVKRAERRVGNAANHDAQPSAAKSWQLLMNELKCGTVWQGCGRRGC